MGPKQLTDERKGQGLAISRKLLTMCERHSTLMGPGADFDGTHDLETFQLTSQTKTITGCRDVGASQHSRN